MFHYYSYVDDQGEKYVIKIGPSTNVLVLDYDIYLTVFPLELYVLVICAGCKQMPELVNHREDCNGSTFVFKDAAFMRAAYLPDLDKLYVLEQVLDCMLFCAERQVYHVNLSLEMVHVSKLDRRKVFVFDWHRSIYLQNYEYVIEPDEYDNDASRPPELRHSVPDSLDYEKIVSWQFGRLTYEYLLEREFVFPLGAGACREIAALNERWIDGEFYEEIFNAENKLRRAIDVGVKSPVIRLLLKHTLRACPAQRANLKEIQRLTLSRFDVLAFPLDFFFR